MKLYRFIAFDSARAMHIIRERLGNDAMIYSMRTIPDGVEAIAGSDAKPTSTEGLTEIDLQHHKTNQDINDKLHIHLQLMEENILKLSNYVMSLQQEVRETKRKRWFSLDHVVDWFLPKKPSVEAPYDRHAV